jgi:hydroxymethyl cephem carbamoyltransferase
MRVLAHKPGHDGHVAYVRDEHLVFSIEAEKDSGPRHAPVSPDLYARTLQLVEEIPDVVATSGWWGRDSVRSMIGGGYMGSGIESIATSNARLFGRASRSFTSSHERSHIMCSYALSPFPQGQPCYALVWEGVIGSFYRIDEQVQVQKLGTPLTHPGTRYAFLYGLADPTFAADREPRPEDAGKLMALASFGRNAKATPEQKEVIDFVLSPGTVRTPSPKQHLSTSRFCNIGLESPAFKDLAWVFSEALYDVFHAFAKSSLHERLPLLISGGCGLNCDWNSAWKASGLFADVFVPPCANDSGSAIGTAVDAMHHFTGRAKLQWDVYAGEDFILDEADLTGIEVQPLDLHVVASFLNAGNIVAWAQGRYEMGPRALGNRSILAMPFTAETQRRLNRIKQREGFRPIAPVCLEEELDKHFVHQGPSPHMLYFQRVKTDALAAVTHVDGSARVQTVNATQNAQLHRLLVAFRDLTGYGVLCNTSLNFKGAGFINRLSDLARFARQELDGFVVGDRFYTIRRTASSAAPAQR